MSAMEMLISISKHILNCCVLDLGGTGQKCFFLLFNIFIVTCLTKESSLNLKAETYLQKL